MCGIVGEVSASRERVVSRDLLRRMCAAIVHRGPDDEGIHASGRAGLGMRRLSIIDLDGGHQPIFNEDETVVTVFNGEIYNFRELRRELEARGHAFRTSTDTEVIVHLYEEHGEDFVERLHGMFALAVWDSVEEKLLLARDRLGKKPLFYYQDESRLLFGSEIKALLQDPSIPREADPAALEQILALGHTLSPKTGFRGIRQLLHASLLVYERGRSRERRYWDLRFATREPYTESAAVGELTDLLSDAVTSRMIADVPLGALLSGGIDSSLVVALMSRASSEPIKTFSIGFDEDEFSELPLARMVAEKYGTQHHEFVVKPEIEELLPRLVRHHDQPFYDSSAIPTYYVCKMAREHVTVALSGDGGDELFAGYRLYLAGKAAELYRRLPRVVHEYLALPVSRLVPESTGRINRGRVLRQFLKAARMDPLERHLLWATKVKMDTRRRLYRAPELRAVLADGAPALEELYRRQQGASPLSRLLYLDTNTELVDDILVKVDRMSMANSLEIRSPLLDHRLHEFAATLPDRAKIRRWTPKYLLRRLARDLLPAPLLKSPKRGFSVPLDRWFQGPLAPLAREILFDVGTEARGYFHPAFVRRMLEDHVAGTAFYGRELWTLLTIELWHRMYVDTFERVDA